MNQLHHVSALLCSNLFTVWATVSTMPSQRTLIYCDPSLLLVQ